MATSLRHVTFGESALRSRRRAKRSRRLVLWSSLAVLLYGSLWYLARSEAFAVGDVAVEGNVVASSSAVEAVARGVLDPGTAWSALSLLPGTNAYLAPKARVAAAVRETFPEVADVSVSREGNDLRVAVVERERWGYWCRDVAAGEECFALDRDGQIFAREAAAASSTRFAGQVEAADPVRASYASPEIFAGLRDLLEALRAAGLSPTRVAAEGAARFRVQLAEGPYLLVDASLPGAQTAQNLRVALGERGLARIASYEYVDLRLPRKVFLKARGGAAEAASSTPAA